MLRDHIGLNRRSIPRVQADQQATIMAKPSGVSCPFKTEDDCFFKDDVYEPCYFPRQALSYYYILSYADLVRILCSSTGQPTLEMYRWNG